MRRRGGGGADGVRHGDARVGAWHRHFPAPPRRGPPTTACTSSASMRTAAVLPASVLPSESCPWAEAGRRVLPTLPSCFANAGPALSQSLAGVRRDLARTGAPHAAVREAGAHSAAGVGAAVGGERFPDWVARLHTEFPTTWSRRPNSTACRFRSSAAVTSRASTSTSGAAGSTTSTEASSASCASRSSPTGRSWNSSARRKRCSRSTPRP